MIRYFIAVSILLISQMVHADLAQDLRSLRNTISETSKTSKELGGLVGSNNEPASQNTTAQTVSTGMSSGDVLVGKINNIKLYQDADKKAKVIDKLAKQEEMIFTGKESNGFYSITSSSGAEGWVEKMLVRKR